MNARTEPLLSNPKGLLLNLAQQQSVSSLLDLIVSRLSESGRIALVRIWLTQPTSSCLGCPSIEACKPQTHCLHLVASGGRSAVSPTVEWTSTEGGFRRMP